MSISISITCLSKMLMKSSPWGTPRVIDGWNGIKRNRAKLPRRWMRCRLTTWKLCCFKTRVCLFVSWTAIYDTSTRREVEPLAKDRVIRNHSEIMIIYVDFHLLFNPCLKTASIPPHTDINRGLSSPIGFFTELSSPWAASRKRKDRILEGKFTREFFSEAFGSFTFKMTETGLCL